MTLLQVYLVLISILLASLITIAAMLHDGGSKRNLRIATVVLAADALVLFGVTLVYFPYALAFILGLAVVTFLLGMLSS